MNDKKSDWLAREREEYYETTLSSAWDGFHRPPFWT